MFFWKKNYKKVTVESVKTVLKRRTNQTSIVFSFIETVQSTNEAIAKMDGS